MNDLKPCPRCGGQAKMIHQVFWCEDDPPEDDYDGYIVRCTVCGRRSYSCLSEEEAVEDWNGMEVKE